MNTLALALRNLLRNRRRSLTTLLAVMLGAISILLFGGYVRNVVYGLETGFVMQSGHLQIQHADFFRYGSGNPAAYGIANYRDIIDKLKNDPDLAPKLAVVTPTLQIGGLAGNFAAGVSRTVIGQGIEVAEQNKLLHWNDYAFPLNEPELALTGTAQDSTVIGTGVARVLQLCTQLKVTDCSQKTVKTAASSTSEPDDIAALAGQDNPVHSSSPTQIELLAPSPHGAPNVVQLNVVKAEQQPVKELDDIYVALHLAQAQKLIYGKSTPEVTAILVQLKHTADLSFARERIEQILSKEFSKQPLAVLDFATINPFYTQTINMFNVIFGFISILIGAIVLFMLGNTMSMTVVERTVEIGTLRSIGLRRDGIRRLFICEGLLLGLIGAGLGVVCSIVISSVINHSGLTWIPPGRMLPVPLTVRVWGEVPLIAGSMIGLMLVATLSAWWPARHASQLNIVEALRHV
jgi:putative ABC transport system permease protein